MIAALYVARNGVYFRQAGIDAWDVARDARGYPGPWPVVAHPPCQRWGRYWGGGPMLAGTAQQKILGDDGGCFLAALGSVRRFGGVLEHPADSHAFNLFVLGRPPRAGGWVRSVDGIGWICHVEQGFYGHTARKATWLYCVGLAALPDLQWGNAGKFHPLARLDAGFHSKEERRRAQKRGTLARLSKNQRIATPIPFRDLLVSIARACRK